MSEKLFFKPVVEEDYIKYKMNGLSDPDGEYYQVLSYSLLIKNEIACSMAEEEYINSYIKAANIIAKNNDDSSSAVKIIVGNCSLALPCIYLCRQALELSIKRSISKKNQSYEPIHNIKELWENYKKIIINELATSEEKELLENMEKFIDIICKFDNKNGTKLRYPVKKDGTLSQDEFFFVNLKHLTETTELFIHKLRLLS